MEKKTTTTGLVAKGVGGGYYCGIGRQDGVGGASKTVWSGKRCHLMLKIHVSLCSMYC